ncbi:hypothetical protein [Cellulosilyticum ruminicola]|uniref:hypothetical protein n=1 Tax=Cellulosilyticum ruminicola TaxID=425254 RepID=UPI0006CFDB89|nr:hypothetical protein [Cellulosilyticum ruminicola]
MDKSRIFSTMGCLMTAGAIIFISYALDHPKLSFIGGKLVAFSIYALYILITVIFFIIGHKK